MLKQLINLIQIISSSESYESMRNEMQSLKMNSNADCKEDQLNSNSEEQSIKKRYENYIAQSKKELLEYKDYILKELEENEEKLNPIKIKQKEINEEFSKYKSKCCKEIEDLKLAKLQKELKIQSCSRLYDIKTKNVDKIFDEKRKSLDQINHRMDALKEKMDSYRGNVPDFLKREKSFLEDEKKVAIAKFERNKEKTSNEINEQFAKKIVLKDELADIKLKIAEINNGVFMAEERLKKEHEMLKRESKELEDKVKYNSDVVKNVDKNIQELDSYTLDEYKESLNRTIEEINWD